MWCVFSFVVTCSDASLRLLPSLCSTGSSPCGGISRQLASDLVVAPSCRGYRGCVRRNGSDRGIVFLGGCWLWRWVCCYPFSWKIGAVLFDSHFDQSVECQVPPRNRRLRRRWTIVWRKLLTKPRCCMSRICSDRKRTCRVGCFFLLNWCFRIS